MKNTALNWHKLGWDKFEDLVAHVAGDIFRGISFARYLKQGNVQHGVDVTGYNPKTARHICIQCKDTQLDTSALKEISGKFSKGQFFPTSEIFILATTADLQNKNAQDFIRTLESQYSQHEIAFECWDINRLETLLKNHFRVVHHFFGLDQAQQHCLPPAPAAVQVSPLVNFIPRGIVNLDEKNGQDNYWGFEKEKVYSLTDILTSDPIHTKSVCLLADPYEGKTLLLQNTINELLDNGQRYYPLLLRIKTLPISPIEELLDISFRTWQSVPARDTIIFIDGLDEVPTDRFLDTLSNINLFRVKYPYISLVISCRKLFFHHYKVNTNLSCFSYYELTDLSYYHLDEYLNRNLRFRKNSFLKKMDRSDLKDFLRKPFYLINLVKWYKKDPRSIPAGKIDIINRFIEESLDISESRRLSGSEILDHKRIRYKQVILKFALALQLSGLNSAPKEFIQELFDFSEIELLQNSPIVSNTGGYWSFYTAMFQEQLAAMQLKDYPFEKISSLVTVGSEVKKIRTKWIQTVASYLSVTADESPSRKEMIKLISEDNPEILTICDADKFSGDFRLWVITNIMERSIEKQIRLLLVHEKVIATFIDRDNKINGYLIRLLDSWAPDRVKIVCCRILRESHIDKELEPLIESIVKQELLRTATAYYAKLLCELLAKNLLGNSEFIDQFINCSAIVKEHECREGLYILLVALGLVDEYYDFGLEGFPILIVYNTGVNHHASERELEQFFLHTASPDHLIRLYRLLSSPPWLGFYQNKATSTKEFIAALADLSVKLYDRDKRIMLPVLNFFMAMEKRHFSDGINSIGQFFRSTDTSGLALELYLLKSREKHYHHEISALIEKKDFDRMLRLAHDGEATIDELDSIYSSLVRDARAEESDEFRIMTQLVLKRPKEKKNNQYQIYLEAEEVIKNNDYLFLASREAFATAIKNFFGYFKSGTIKTETLFQRRQGRQKRTHLESNHLLSFLNSCGEPDGKITLADSLQLLERPNYFEIWRAEKILKSKLSQSERDLDLRRVLEEFYNCELKKANFQGFFTSGTIHDYSRTENLLTKIWTEMEFATTDETILEFTWMMTGGIKTIASAELNKKKSLAGSLLKHFEANKEALEGKILDNFHKGIKNERIIASHLELCKKLGMSDVNDIIIELIKEKQIGYNTIYSALEIYRELNGDLELLLPYLHSLDLFENYNFERLVQYLIKEFPDEVTPRLGKALKSERISHENKISAARYLAQSGIPEGFSYIINLMQTSNEVPYEIQSDFEIWNVDSAWALKEVEKVLYLYLDTDFRDDAFYRSPDYFILEILKGLAGKSEKDLLLVLRFMEENSDKHLEEYGQTAKDLIWYAENMLEEFRARDEGQMGVREIKEFLQ